MGGSPKEGTWACGVLPHGLREKSSWPGQIGNQCAVISIDFTKVRIYLIKCGHIYSGH